VKTAQEGNPHLLTDALRWLKPKELNELLTNTTNGNLISLVDRVNKGNPEYLVDVLLRLEPNALKEVFIDKRNRILDLLVNNRTSELLALVLLDSILGI
jgi:hypothetical protein